MAGSQAAILINDLATDYEKLAERAEIKANGKKPRSNGKRRRIGRRSIPVSTIAPSRIQRITTDEETDLS
jgi:hypothetical protein